MQKSTNTIWGAYDRRDSQRPAILVLLQELDYQLSFYSWTRPMEQLLRTTNSSMNDHTSLLESLLAITREPRHAIAWKHVENYAPIDRRITKAEKITNTVVCSHKLQSNIRSNTVFNIPTFCCSTTTLMREKMPMSAMTANAIAVAAIMNYKRCSLTFLCDFTIAAFSPFSFIKYHMCSSWLVKLVCHPTNIPVNLPD